MSSRTQRSRKRKAVLMTRLREFGLPPGQSSTTQNVPMEDTPTLTLVDSHHVSHSNSLQVNECHANCPSPSVSLETTDINSNPELNLPCDVDRNEHQENSNETHPFSISSIKPPYNSASFKIAKLASAHRLTDKCVEDIIKLLHEEPLRSENIRNVRNHEHLLGISKLSVVFYWVCDLCGNVSKNSAFKRPYSMVCCNKKLEENLDHFVLFNVKEQVALSVEGTLPTAHSDWEKRELMKEIYGLTIDDITITLNTDGAPLFTSSKSSLWPLLGFIDHISFTEQKQRVMLLGLWISKGSKKPDFKVFFKDFVQDLKLSSNEYIQWTNKLGNNKTSRIYVSKIMCDSIARPAVQMMSQFNAEYGCGYCYHKEKGHYYSHKEIVARSGLEHREIVEQCTSKQSSMYGILSPSPFMDIPYLDMIKDFPVDVLHCVYLGVVEHFTCKWLNPSFKREEFHISEDSRNCIDLMLTNIRPPERVSRLPRSLTSRGSFKGHEWSMWLYYYSPIILQNILPADYYDHWLMLVNGIALLNCKENMLTNENMERGGLLLNDFSEKVEKLYGKTSCRFNVHLLRHLKMCVKRFGPLHSFSMSVFESYNAVLKHYVTSSFGVAQQVVRRYSRDALIRENTSPLRLERKPLNTEELSNYRNFFELGDDDANYVKKALIGNKIFTSKSNTRSKKRCSYFYWTSTDMVIEVFFYCTNDKGTTAFGIIHNVQRSQLQVDHIYEQRSYEYSSIDASLITSSALFIESGTKYFLKFINDCEFNSE